MFPTYWYSSDPNHMLNAYEPIPSVKSYSPPEPVLVYAVAPTTDIPVSRETARIWALAMGSPNPSINIPDILAIQFSLNRYDWSSALLVQGYPRHFSNDPSD